MNSLHSDTVIGARRLPWKRRALLGLEKCLGNMRLAKAFSRLRPSPGATLLMYHSVVTDEESAWIDPRNSIPLDLFRQQMELLARSATVLSMTELVDCILAGGSPKPGSVVITFDDGYLDNWRRAAPVLRELDLPAVVYLATGYVDRGLSQWIDHLYSSFRCRTKDRLCLSIGHEIVFDLSAKDRRLLAYEACSRELLRMKLDERSIFLASLDQQLEPEGDVPRLTMNWDEVKRMREASPGIEIGVHTRDHLDLVLHESLLEEQVEASVRDVRRELGLSPSHFSFPYCRSNVRTREILRSTGLRSAVSSSTGRLNAAGSDLFDLSRIEAPRSMGLFRLYASGAYPALPMLLTGKA